MPLSHGKSKKSFEKNIKTEMKHGKPQKQALAIAYDVQRRSKPRKKMADGGDPQDGTRAISGPESDNPVTKSLQKAFGIQPAKKAHGGMIDDEEMMKRRMAEGGFVDRKMYPNGEASDAHIHRYGDSVIDSEAMLEGRHPGSRLADRAYHARGESLEQRRYTPGIDDEEMMHQSRDSHANPSLSESHMSPHDDESLEAEHEREHEEMVEEIMRKRRMYADGGEVDLRHNSMEQPNSYYNRNEHAALKENYDSDMEDMHQPMDSNEHADESESESENEHDMIGAIRRKMAAKRKA